MIPTYDHHSPSGLNLFAASPAMFVLERVLGLKQPVGVPAHRGVAVETGVARGLKDPEAEKQACIKTALAKYDELTAMSGDDRRERYRTTIHDMVMQALNELRPYGPPSAMQGYTEWKAPGLKFPIMGFYDFKYEDQGIIVDLKTTERMPTEIKFPHARQVSLYAASDNMEGRLTYVTPKKCQTFRLESLREHREALFHLARTVENFLSLSDDPKFFLSITAPDLESFYWGTPNARQLAFEHWNI